MCYTAISSSSGIRRYPWNDTSFVASHFFFLFLWMMIYFYVSDKEKSQTFKFSEENMKKDLKLTLF